MDIDRGLVNAVVFLDLKEAFDTVDHVILLRKLQYYGICCTSHQWFASSRRQRGRVVRAPDLKSRGHGLKSRSDQLAGVVSRWTLVQLLGHACI